MSDKDLTPDVLCEFERIGKRRHSDANYNLNPRRQCVPASRVRCGIRVLCGISGVKTSEIEGVTECIFEWECARVAVFMDVSFL